MRQNVHMVDNEAEAEEVWQRKLAGLLDIALKVGGIRLAVAKMPVETDNLFSLFTMSPFERRRESLAYKWMALSPGESPPDDLEWTIYEHRAEGWVGRPAK